MRSALWLTFFFAVAACAEPSSSQLTTTTSEPRAFGYQIGDLLSITVTIHAPEGEALDESSVPQPGGRGRALELRDVGRRISAEQNGRRYELTFLYQIFFSPPQTRTLETPGFKLRFGVPGRMQEVRVEEWPVTVSPLMPVAVSPRRGLGALRPDLAPPLIDTRSGHQRLMGYGAAALLLLMYLTQVYVGLPWWRRAHRPFALASRELRGLTPASSDKQWRGAFRSIHEALNQTCGQVLFEPGIDRFVRDRPRFKHLRGDLTEFFQKSHLEHFNDAAQGDPDRAWLIGLCRRCRDAERSAP